MASRFKAFAPTVREVFWFLLWAAVVGLIYFAATKFLSTRQRASVRPVPTTTRVLSPLEPHQPEPGRAQNKARAGSSPEVVSSGTRKKSGWAPDAKEEKGDARQIFPEEVLWLKERLAKVVPKPKAPLQNEHAVASQIVERVGRIHYVAKSHGWSLPEQTLSRNFGDCQDKSLLLAELLIEAGIREVAICRGVTENYKPGEAGHAWVLVMLGSELWKVESTNGTMYRANTGSNLDRHEAIATVWRLPATGLRR